MTKDAMIQLSLTHPSVFFRNTVLANSILKLNESEKLYTVLCGIDIFNGDAFGAEGCMQVIYAGENASVFLEKMTKLADRIGLDSLLYIAFEGQA